MAFFLGNCLNYRTMLFLAEGFVLGRKATSPRFFGGVYSGEADTFFSCCPPFDMLYTIQPIFYEDDSALIL